MTKYGIHRSKRRLFIPGRALFILIILVPILLVTGYISKVYFDKDSPADQSQDRVSMVDEPSHSISSVKGRYLFNGTAVFARMVERAAGDDLSQPFSMMHTFEPEKYDAMTLDWECPSTEEVIPYETQVSRLLFNCHVKWLPEVSKHFSIVSLSNNHSGDLGQEAFLQTQINLADAGIQTYGNYDPSIEEDVCEVIALPVRLQKSDNVEEQGILPVAFCSWHYFFRQPQPGEMELMEEYANVLPVFGFQHAGAEYYAQADSNQVGIARKMIDLGAEFAIGNSPHWVQNGEVYRGKPIFYSTGNFIFDQIDYETMRGLSIDVSIEVPYDDNVGKWLELGESCRARADSCLDLAIGQGLEKVDIKLVYDVVGSSGGARRITQKADENLQRAIEERVGWQGMRSELDQ